jgi:predicted transcriptional regulator
MSEGPGSAREQVLFLARAESRVRIIEVLGASDSATQQELRAQVDTSRTTVSRALQSLTEAGWVERFDGGYRLTRTGEILAGEFGRLLDSVRRVDDLAEFLRWFPADVDGPDFLDVSDVEVTYSTDADPYAPARKQSEVLHTADRLRILLPAIDLDSTKTIVEQVTERGLEVETVVSPGVEATMESEQFAPLLTEMLQTGRASLAVAPADVPFYLGLADDGLVQVGLADGDGLPSALLETTDTTVREWARRTYQRHLERARRKSVAEL